MNFQLQPVNAVLEEMAPLAEKHWNEVAHYKDIPLSPNVEQYLKLEELGLLRVYTARDGDRLVGYLVFFINYHMHYMSSLQANQDVFFVDPEYRGFGSQFLMWCHEQLKKEGVQVVSQHIKAKHNFGPMLERLGYELVDLIYLKRLD